MLRISVFFIFILLSCGSENMIQAPFSISESIVPTDNSGNILGASRPEQWQMSTRVDSFMHQTWKDGSNPAYPNPAVDSTVICYEVGQLGRRNPNLLYYIGIEDRLKTPVAIFCNGESIGTGSYRKVWNLCDMSGSRVPAAYYRCYFLVINNDSIAYYTEGIIKTN